jgi:hypothetical protein
MMWLLFLQARCGEIDAETATLMARREQLTAVVAATPQPARSRQAAAKLRSAADKLELLSGLQVRAVGCLWYEDFCACTAQQELGACVRIC